MMLFTAFRLWKDEAEEILGGWSREERGFVHWLYALLSASGKTALMQAREDSVWIDFRGCPVTWNRRDHSLDVGFGCSAAVTVTNPVKAARIVREAFKTWNG